MSHLFLDSDGVLADFDSYFASVFGQDATEFEAEHGSKRIWHDLSQHEDFYFKLPPMPDAFELYEAVKHLKPTVLTGRPANGVWAVEQKVRWYAKHFPDLPVIVCLSREKCFHMKNQGDLLVDDRLKYRPFWVDAGGIFVHHTSAKSTIAKLKELAVL